MASNSLKKADEEDAGAKPAGEISDFVPLRKLASHVLIKCRCDDCCTERVQSVSQYVTAGVSPLTTVASLSKTEKCTRRGCGGDLVFSLDLGE